MLKILKEEQKMNKYEVKDVVCDYGIFENGVLIPQLILNSKSNATIIKDILDVDQQHKRVVGLLEVETKAD
ncbi:hypothetical protein IV70_GL000008 [Carnobacterium maltaromaticum DSM 20342]|nr:hypothetical protein IV70_GL000008 [Carnobacterium maltaromaticum DSM 20342]